MPDELPSIEKLLRLKRHERPPDGFFDAFLENFHRRQRTDLLKVSAWQLWRERAAARLQDFRILFPPRWVYAAGAAYLALMIGLYFRSSRPTEIAELEAARQRAYAQQSAHSSAGAPVREREVSTRAAPGRKVTPGVVAVSQESSGSENLNGLRRRPGDASAHFEMVPLAVPSAASGDTAEPAVNGGQVIILVR
jgi:hypothetical protein